MVLVDNEIATAIFTGVTHDDFWGYTVNFFLVNKTSDKTLTFKTDDSSANDVMLENYWGQSISPGMSAYTSFSWDDDTLKNNGISSLDKIEFSFVIEDSYDYWSDPFFKEYITLNP